MTEVDRRRSRTLDEEEVALWEYAMRGTKSLRPRAKLDDPEQGADDELSSQLVAKPPAANMPVQPAAPSNAKSKPVASDIATLDRRQTRLISNGRASIDARLDLHGMRQHEAHAALKSFLYSAQARGARVVLVITGKGGRRKTQEREFFPYSDDEPGVLKRLTPRWLQDPELRHIVVSFGASGIQHGGDGALYVRLRKPR